MKFWSRDPGLDKKTFFFLWILCIIGSLALLPYIHAIGLLKESLAKVFVLTLLQSAVLFGILCYLSFKILPHTDLKPFPKKVSLYTGILVGVVLGFVILFLAKTVLHHPSFSHIDAPWWTGFLASIYGGVNEEVMIRLFLFSLLYFLLRKYAKNYLKNRLALLWTANILAALFFGLGHLPAAFKLGTPSSFEISQILLLNGLAGIAFGWLYWSRGLWTAIIAHFVTDLVIHVFFI